MELGEILTAVLNLSLNYIACSTRFQTNQKNLFSFKFKSSGKAVNSLKASSPFAIQETTRVHPSPKEDLHAPLALSALLRYRYLRIPSPPHTHTTPPPRVRHTPTPYSFPTKLQSQLCGSISISRFLSLLISLYSQFPSPRLRFYYRTDLNSLTGL